MSPREPINLYSLNPFFYIKTRKIIFWYILINFLVVIQCYLLDWITPLNLLENRRDFEFSDNIYDLLAVLIIFIISFALLIQQGKIRKINSQSIVGKVPNNYPWLTIIVLIIFKIIFSTGTYYVLNYPLSFIFPQWVETNLATNIFSEASQSSLPFLYFILTIAITYILREFLGILVIDGILLHRWAIKWGNTKAVLAIGLWYGISFYSNFINGFITGIIVSLLYIKSRTLIVPLVFRIISISISLIIEAYYFFIVQSDQNNILQQFQSEFKL